MKLTNGCTYICLHTVVINHAVFALDASTRFLLLLCQEEEGERGGKKLDRWGMFVLCITAPQWIKLQFINLDTDFHLFHCTSPFAFIWEQQTESGHVLQFNLPVM